MYKVIKQANVTINGVPHVLKWCSENPKARLFTRSGIDLTNNGEMKTVLIEIIERNNLGIKVDSSSTTNDLCSKVIDALNK